MNRSILIAVTTLALGASVAPAAPGRDYDRGDRHGDRYEDRHEGTRDARRDESHDDAGRDYGDDDRCREERYVVHFHLDGGDREVRAASRERAHRIAAFLRSVGAEAHVDGRRTVHYELRGEAEVVRHSDADAHRLAEKLEGYGFHAHVDHE